ncbi:hypothetical protein [Halorussus amylolyticus]|uniref:hypothetical protein n=1 Tax=Halorussus amylolyticus TaxID=1126242 RepID=UPI001EE3E3C9|nr:hypothetical protein [Halorussus amylolyticus]
MYESQETLAGVANVDETRKQLLVMESTVTAQVVAWSRRCRHVVAWLISPR